MNSPSSSLSSSLSSSPSSSPDSSRYNEKCNYQPRILKILNIAEFATQVVGIAGCWFYLNSITTHTSFNLYNDISIMIIGVFLTISAILLITSFRSNAKRENVIGRSRPALRLFQIFGYVSLLTVVGYASFLGFSNKFEITFHAGNMLYFKLAILALTLFSLFYNSMNMCKILSLIGWIATDKKKKKFICTFLIFNLLLIPFLGLMFFNVIHVHTLKTLFLATAIYCGVMAIVSCICLCLACWHYKETVKSNKKQEQLSSDEQDPRRHLPITGFLRTIRHNAMSILSFTLFGTGIRLMMFDNSYFHFVSICILLAGFVMQISSTTVGNKCDYDYNAIAKDEKSIYFRVVI